MAFAPVPKALVVTIKRNDGGRGQINNEQKKIKIKKIA
jgi:hypothetical protein